MTQNVRIGELLIQNGLLTQEQLEDALQYQRLHGEGKKIGAILIEQGYVSEDDFLEALHRRLGVPIVDVSNLQLNSGAISLLPRAIAEKYGVLPLRATPQTLTVAMQNPTDYYAIQEIEQATRRTVEPVLAKQRDIRTAVERGYQTVIDSNLIREAVSTAAPSETVSTGARQATERISNAPVVQLVNAMLAQARRLRASDIHIEPRASNVQVRFRVDGDLIEIMTLDSSVHGSIVTRIKIMAELDIAERRLPQDGRLTVTIDGQELSTRVSTMPTIYGEKVVLRLMGGLDSGRVQRIDQLGFSPEAERLVRRMLSAPSGILLSAGPTGSGKTTTMYAALRELARPQVNIVSIEDPVENAVAGVNQMQVNTKMDLTFASGLRAAMRQDPDIILIGEIRDPETATIAARAAITGHLVLSTIHTNDAPSTFARLINMEVEPYVVAAAMVGVISQRLVKTLCPHCKERVEVNEEVRRMVPQLSVGEKIWRPVGCTHCNNTGYMGRTAVHEVLPVTGAIRALIEGTAPAEAIRQAAGPSFATLRDSMLRLVREGRSSLQELLRITFTMD